MAESYRPAPPVEAARRAGRLGLLGGSFDPPHLGHLHAARRARAAFELEHVLFIPASRPPHKPERTLVPAAERLEMLDLLLAEEPWTSVWPAELGREGPSYTLDTLLLLRACVADGTRLYLILGQDNLPGFPRWHGIEEILRLAQPIVVHRGGADPAELLGRAEVRALSGFARTRLTLGCLSCATLDVSSTELREALERGSTPEGVLPASLAEYIRDRGLYRSP